MMNIYGAGSCKNMIAISIQIAITTTARFNRLDLNADDCISVINLRHFVWVPLCQYR